jgi:single-strand DNA-binding protein
MASFNKVILLGNLTRDPEMRYTPSGTPVASFGLAVNRRYRQGDEQKEEVCFVDISTFGRQAELAGEYLSKGRMVLIEGRLQFRTWEDQNGQRRSKLDVVAERVNFMPRASQDDGGSRQSTGGAPPSYQDDDIPPPQDDDIPF